MAAFLACVGLASCSQDELTEQGTPLPVGQYPLEMTAGGLQAVAAPSPASTRGTVEGNWNGVQSVMVQDGQNAPKAYQVTPNGNTSAATLSCNDPYWWTSTSERKTVTAWHPVRHPDDATINFENRGPQPGDRWSVPADQSSKDFDASAYDLIYDDGTWISFADRKNASLNFRHTLSKVVVNLMPSPYLEANSQDVSVPLINCYLSGAFGFIIAGSKLVLQSNTLENKSLTMRKVATNAQAFASYDALVIPQYLYKQTILIKVGAVSYTCLLNTLTKSFKDGQCHTFNITVKEHGLDVQVSSSIGWFNTTGGSSGTVTFPK